MRLASNDAYGLRNESLGKKKQLLDQLHLNCYSATFSLADFFVILHENFVLPQFINTVLCSFVV